ncbi:large subunit ribosomal protein L19e [Nematocida homosporus]|uniref:large subunit ribosomal protein L19e n=1 Tax=Nematocida homosporus TaxID=1912981 RepID=UPI00221F28B2|nr:large subunit ribosomal protein L19e [Nematocida homosporus]KAI5184334.1 large subunit ribosomal protein L19e [Nematocida homosporus]
MAERTEKPPKYERPDLTKVRKMAAKVLDCGKNKIWLDPSEATALAEGKTEEQVTKMVEDGLIVQRPTIGNSRGRVRQFRLERSMGRHRGLGRRRGTRNARFPEKKIWMLRIRAIRKDLKGIRDEGRIDRAMYRAVYLKAKAGCFKSRKMMKEYIANEELRKKKEEMVMAQMGGMQ